MTRQHSILLFLNAFLVAAFCASAQIAKADLILGFLVDGGNTFTNSISGSAGSQFAVSLILRQQPGETRLTSDGLQTFGIVGAYDPAKLGVSNITTTSAFLETNNTNNVVTGTFEVAGLSFAPPKGSNVLLATFDIEILKDASTLISFGDLDTRETANNFTLGSNIEIDSDIFAFTAGTADRSKQYHLQIKKKICQQLSFSYC